MRQGEGEKRVDQKRKDARTGVLDNEDVHFRNQDLVRA